MTTGLTQSIELEHRAQDHACQAKSAHRELEEGVAGCQVLHAVVRVPEADGANAMAEVPRDVLVLAVNVPGDAASDRDLGVAGLAREVPTRGSRQPMDIAEADTGLHLEQPGGAIEVDHTVPGPHVDVKRVASRGTRERTSTRRREQ